MRCLLVYAHPEPTSFTHALMERARDILRAAGHDCELSDLYADSFNAVAGRHDFTSVDNPDRLSLQGEQARAAAVAAVSDDLRREQQRLSRADLVIFLFPLWWGGPPAILKGWFDRVLAFGFAYREGTRFETGLFRGKRAMVCATTGGTAHRFTDGGTYGSIRQVLWPLEHCVLDYLGLDRLDPFIAYAAPRVDDAGRQAYLDAWDRHLRLVLRDGQASGGV
ncbi:MAG: NAD(P)H-dependent oxidoreductase [Telmatospirillum sp.]|nr:NAD(P)H-dependent oxidoreductase [Telmatospirillum sp.]